MKRVLVVGGGLAGLRAATAAALAGAGVTVLTKVHPLASHSVAATGGLNVSLGDGDSWEDHARDTVRGAGGLADVDAVEHVCREASGEVRLLERWGVPFDRDGDGHLGRKLLGGATAARTVFAGDHTGKALLQALWQRAASLGILIRDDMILLDLAVSDRCTGIVGLDLRTGGVHGEQADAVIIATGGLGRLYAGSTNAAICTGDGTAAAFRAGAALLDMEMTQFYPTCFVGSGICVTEEARSKGGIMVTGDGDRFLSRYAPDTMEMTNRDVLCRAIFAERAANRRVFLDCRPVAPADIQGGLRVFAQTARRLTDTDITMQPLEVGPGMHYHMGGIATDLDGRTTIPGLYAAGECACLSVHGANRIGGNSLLETLVMGRAAGEAAAHDASADRPSTQPRELARLAQRRLAGLRARGGGDVYQQSAARAQLGRCMNEDVGVIRNATTLARARDSVAGLRDELFTIPVGDASQVFNQALRRFVELENLVLLGEIVINAATARRESRGAHYRTDGIEPELHPRHTRAAAGPDGRASVTFVPVRDRAPEYVRTGEVSQCT